MQSVNPPQKNTRAKSLKTRRASLLFTTPLGTLQEHGGEGVQTSRSLLCPRGALCYFHFTNNLRTAMQDAGSGGASLQNREKDTSLAWGQVYIWVSDPWQEGRGEKLLAHSDNFKWRYHFDCWFEQLRPDNHKVKQSSEVNVNFELLLELILLKLFLALECGQQSSALQFEFIIIT